MGTRIEVRSQPLSASYEFDQDRILVGRGSGADVRLPHQAVSIRHVFIQRRGTQNLVVDEGSSNGTFVNGTRLVSGRPKTIRAGDVVQIGPFRLTVEVAVPIAQPSTAERTSTLAKSLLRGEEGSSLAPATLTVVNGPDDGQCLQLPLPPARLLVGRSEEADLSLRDADASREHAELQVDLDGVLIRDLGSKNRVSVNGRVGEERRLRDGDEIVVGSTVLLFADPAEGKLKDLEDAEDIPYEYELELEGSSTEPEQVESEETSKAAPEAEAEDSASPESSTSPKAEEAPDGDSSSATGPAEPPAQVAIGSKPSTKPRLRPSADAFIYMLAGLVLLASLAGLLFLVR